MAQSGYTPILIYGSGTASSVPLAANMTSSSAGAELALNYADGKLYFKNSSGVVTLLAQSASASPVTSFQTSLGGLTPSTSTTGAITLAGTLNTSSGGTGLTSFTAGDLPYYATGTALSKLGIGTNGQILTSTGTAPQWSTLSGVAVTTFSAGTTGLTPNTATSGAITLAGTLGIANGGTAQTSFTANYIHYGSFSTSASLQFDGTNLSVGAAPVASKGVLQVGTIGYTDTGVVAGFASSVAGYNQIVLQNTSNNSAASTNFNVSNDAGTTTTNYGELGINSSTFSGTGSFSQAGNVYLAAASTDLVVGTYASKPIHFVVNNGATDAVTIDTANSLNLGGAYTEGVVAIGNSSTSKTLSLATGTFQTVTMTGNCTFTMPTNVAGKSFILVINTGSGGFTGTFTSVKWPSNTAPTLTTTASRWDILTFFADGTNWYGTYAQAFQ